jgi:hypothetical protein
LGDLEISCTSATPMAAIARIHIRSVHECEPVHVAAKQCEPAKGRSTSACGCIIRLLALRNEQPLAAPVSHQKRPHQNATNAIKLERKCWKINKPDRYSPLITVWLQVRVPPGPPVNQWLNRCYFIAPQSPHQKRLASSLIAVVQYPAN